MEDYQSQNKNKTHNQQDTTTTATTRSTTMTLQQRQQQQKKRQSSLPNNNYNNQKSIFIIVLFGFLVIFQMISLGPDLSFYKEAMTSASNTQSTKYNHGNAKCEKNESIIQSKFIDYWFNNNKQQTSFNSLAQIYESILPTISATSAKTNTTNASHYNNDNNNYYYSWIGNHWIPPPGVPIYTPQQMVQFFQKHNTLFIGDSTCRRSYGSLFATLQSNTPHNIPIDSVDHFKVIDVNKGKITEQSCTHLDYSTETARGKLFPPKNQVNHFCRHVPGTLPDAPFGKFDRIGMPCLYEITNFVQIDKEHNYEITKDYTLVVIQMGEWDMLRRSSCVQKQTTNNLISDITAAVASLYELQSSNMTIVWKTTGFDQRGHALNETIAMNTEIMKQIDDLNNSDNIAKSQTNNYNNDNYDSRRHGSNLTYVDWGRVMYPRSFGKDRIVGDIPVHYGLEARKLFPQMLVHHLLDRQQ